MELELLNLRIVDDFVYIDMYEAGNYVGVLCAEIEHLENTVDLKNELFNNFRKVYLNQFVSQKYGHLTLVK